MIRPPIGQRELGKKEKKPKARLKQSRKDRPMSAAAMLKLEDKVMRRDGCCVMIDHTESMCDGKADAHHLIPQRVLKANYPPGDPIFENEANAVALCRHHHNLVERHLLYLPDEVLPNGFAAFLKKHGYEADWDAEIARRT